MMVERVKDGNGFNISCRGPQSILSRFARFKAEEAARFTKIINNFWQRIEANPYDPTSQELLAIEKQAILTVGVERDLEDIFTCRRKIIESLPPENKRDYVDFLLSLANLHFRQNDFSYSEKVLSAVIVGDLNNWHALKELAISLGVQGKISLALSRFKEAETIRQEYEKKGFAVSKTEAWEAKFFAARFRITSVTAENPFVSREELLSLLQPIFPGLENFAEIETFYYDQLGKITDTLIKNGVPWSTIVYVFGQKMSQERERKWEELTSLGPLPFRLYLVFEKVLKETTPEIKLEEIFSFFNEIEPGYGKKAVALAAFLKVTKILEEKGLEGKEEIRQFLKPLELKKLTVKLAIEEIEKYARRCLKEMKEEEKIAREAEKREAKIREITSLLQEVRNGNRSLADEYQNLSQRLSNAYKELTSDEIKQKLFTEITQTLRELLANPARLESQPELEGLILLGQELWNIEERFPPALRLIIQESFEQEPIKKLITALLKDLREEIYYRIKALAQEKPIAPKTDEFYTKRERIHDFFFARLGNLPQVKEIFAEIEVPYAQPVALRSSWYGMFADFADKPSRRIELLRKSLQEDSQNVVAEIELSRELGSSGDIRESENIARSILGKTTDPIVLVRVSCTQMANLVKQAEKSIKKGESAKVIPEKMGEGEEIFSRAQAAYAQIGKGNLKLETVYSDWKTLLLNVGYLYRITHDFTKASGIYDQILKEFSADFEAYDKAIHGISRVLFLQGKFVEAENFFFEEIKRNKKSLDLYLFLIEALFANGEYQKALEVIGRAQNLQRDLKIDYLNFDLIKTRIFILQGKDEEAKESFGKVQEKFAKFAMKGAALSNFEGVMKLIEANFFAVQGKAKEARNYFQESIQLFLETPDSEFEEAQARWTLVNILSQWALAQKEQKLFQEAVKEGEIFLKKFPFYPLAHQVVIAPLIYLDQEEKALEHIQWLGERMYALDQETLANLILLTVQKNRVQEQAKALLRSWKEKLKEEQFKEYSEKAIELIKKSLPAFEFQIID